ncbi:MAG: YjbH domain-containing protein [Alistipes sp.]|nr:YjbH domain-containing protein [Alistipes sp.]
MKKYIFFGCILVLLNIRLLSAQYFTGTTGLLTIPSADMQRDGTVMIGFNYLNKSMVPVFMGDHYSTYNYYFNATFLPFMEVGYMCTLLRGTDSFVPYKKGKIVNQDRAFSVRFRVLRERKYWPALVIGTNDLYTQTANGQFLGTKGNQYFQKFYLAASKRFRCFKDDEIGVHLSYQYTHRSKDPIKGLALGVNYAPSFAPSLNLILECNVDNLNVGVTYTVLRHLYVQALLQRGSHFSAGAAYKIFLWKNEREKQKQKRHNEN